MNLQEKLDELRSNVLRDTSDLIAGDVDSLWTDETLVRYIKQGELRFARQTLCLRDGTSAQVTQVKLKNGTHYYPLHPSVLGVLSARYDTDNFDLARSGRAILNQIQPPEFLTFDPTANYAIPPGRPSAFMTDETLVFATAGRVTLAVYPDPGPDQDGKLVNLRVLRLPLMKYDMEHLNVESEIPESYELDPLLWAAYLALNNFDADAGARDAADKFKTRFDDAVANCVRETKRKLFANIIHRFGMGGYVWTR